MLLEFTDEESKQIYQGFACLMGINGDPYVVEIHTTGMLSERSYNAICDNISYNGKDSICQYFGMVHWFYLQGKRNA